MGATLPFGHIFPRVCLLWLYLPFDLPSDLDSKNFAYFTAVPSAFSFFVGSLTDFR
jgi:hypothetical protein